VENRLNDPIKILGVSLGPPDSPETYSGVPFHLFEEFRKLGWLVATADSFELKFKDCFRGVIDFKRTFKDLRPHRNALWRYRQKGMEILSRRFREKANLLPQHDVVFQIGVGATPKDGVPLVAHVEISVATATKTDIFARNYGFYGHSQKDVDDAINGEKQFFKRCHMVWTNTHWTAEGIIEQGIDPQKIFVHPPAAGIEDPGICDHDWKQCKILFVGSDWIRKGGPLLIDAFQIIRRSNPNAKLTIVGCKPLVRMEGVEIIGYLRKNIPREKEKLNALYREATIFCLPSYWESTGIVYIEAALWGLPVIMLKGQGREKIYPSSMAVHADHNDSKVLADAIIDLTQAPSKMESMGRAGRKLVLEKYTWRNLADKLYNEIIKRI
jgi:glycosyltransferase involved in cell wall biosynthesis